MCWLRTQSFDLAWVVANADLPAVTWVVRDRSVDELGHGDDSCASGDVPFFDFARLQLVTKCLERPLVASGEHQSGRVVVQAVKDSRFAVVVADTTHLGVPCDQSSGQRTELALSQRMTWNACRLVDHDVPLPFEDNIDIERRIRGSVKIGRAR